MKGKKINEPPKVKYDIFMECAKTEPVDFWKRVLENCSYGQFPRGMTFRDGVLYYKVGKKKQPATKYLPENIEEAKKSVIDFFKAEVGYVSKDEVMRRKIKMRLKLEETLRPHDTVWKDIRAPTTQKQIISEYVIAQQEKLGLSDDMTNQLMTVIVIGLSMGTLIGDDIEMDRGVILDIDNIVRMDNGYFTLRRKELSHIGFNVGSKKSEQSSFSDDWSKYMASYNKSLGIK